MIILPKIGPRTDLKKRIYNSLKKKTHKECVQFAFNTALDVAHLTLSDTYGCIELARQWLINPNKDLENQIKMTVFFLDRRTYAYSCIKFMNHAIIAPNYTYAAFSSISYAIDALENINAKNFYLNEITMKIKPHSHKETPPFNLNDQQEFLIALDFIQEFYHDDLLLQENSLISFKFYDFAKENTLKDLITTIFKNETYKKQITRIIAKLLEN